VTVEPHDPAIESAFEVLNAAMKQESTESLELTFCGHALILNEHMQEEMLASVMAFVVGVGFKCPVETVPLEPVH
jgi:hypothetical protein